ncbi:MAG: phosphoenolpyruvate carboxykinase domain-containing protein, partial [Rhodospirillaceae bacterium]
NTAPEPMVSPFGFSPSYNDLDWTGIDFPKEKFDKIMNIDRAEGLVEAREQSEMFARFGRRLPDELEQERMNLIKRLQEAPPVWKAG